ncbi:leucine-rich repeat domain-containing protein, partial [Legionella drozanskii]|uniref:leucine-rich repeat domain-containing protein n=1 Tax=Legionella drozanskii TaxID=96228 RepID=UPI0010417B97
MQTRIGPNGRILVKVSTNEIYEGFFEIPDDITAIDEGAFKNCLNLQEITIPDNVLTIGEEAFEGCKNLEKVRLSNNLVSIGHSAFADCCSIEQMDIPDSVTAIDPFAFAGCRKLKSIKLPVRLSSLFSNAFDGCENLTEVTLPEGLLTMGWQVFGYCTRLEKIHLPMGLTLIPSFTFTSCVALKEIDIPKGVRSIGSRAFSGCINLKQISIPEGIETIAADAFLNSGVETIFIDSSNEEERVRITNLLPNDLKDKVVMFSKSELLELLDKELRRIINAPEANPLYSLMPRLVQNDFPELPNEILVKINPFLNRNTDCYKKALAAIKDVPLPRIRAGEKGKRDYEDKIKKIVNDCIINGEPSESAESDSYSFFLKALTATAA